MFQKNTKICSKCLVSKPLELFYDRENGKKRHNCIECHQKISSAAAEQRHQDAKEKARAKRLLKEYNLTVKQYNDMLLEQSGCCMICGIHQKDLKQALAVDHNHKTNKIRDLLCDNCNVGVGNFQENINYLTAAIKYLERHNEIHSKNSPLE